MKIKFFIEGQRLKRAKNNYIVADSKNFISADFEFSQEWINLQKSAIFKNADTAYTVLLADNECAVPYEVTGADFCVSVFGVKDNMRITTDEIVIRVEETGYCEGETPLEPTQSVYEQILEKLSDGEAKHTQIEEQLLTKADAEEVSASLGEKADKTQTEEMLLTKADKTEVDEALVLKADKTEVEEALALKADKNETETALSEKAEKTELQQLNTDISARCLSIETTHNEDIQSVRNYITGAYARADNIEAYIIGDENNLKTTAKMIVPAINETYQKAADLQDALTTKADNNMVQSVVNGLDERITNLVERHSKDMETIDETLGDIETALDGIIELQNSYIGGESI